MGGGRSASDIVQFLDTYVEDSQPPPEVTMPTFSTRWFDTGMHKGRWLEGAESCASQVMQLTSNDIFTEHCATKSLCLIAFFPGMVDSSAKVSLCMAPFAAAVAIVRERTLLDADAMQDRNGFIDIMKKLTEKKCAAACMQNAMLSVLCRSCTI